MSRLLNEDVQDKLRGDMVVDVGPDYIVLMSGGTISLTKEQCAELNKYYSDAEGG